MHVHAQTHAQLHARTRANAREMLTDIRVCRYAQKSKKYVPVAQKPPPSVSVVRELFPAQTWTLRFQWPHDRLEAPPADWHRAWNTAIEIRLWEARHPQQREFMVQMAVRYFLMLCTAYFCSDIGLHRLLTHEGVTVPVLHAEPMRVGFDPRDRVVAAEISKLLMETPALALRVPSMFLSFSKGPQKAIPSWMGVWSAYEGDVDVVTGAMHGVGVWRMGSWSYAGNWADGLPHGPGHLTRTLPDGQILYSYKGLFFEGNPSGMGRCEYLDADGNEHVCDGTWSDGQFCS